MSCNKELARLARFMWQCRYRNGFPLPAIYSKFVNQGTDIDTINEIIKVNDLNFNRGAMDPIKSFLQFLIVLKKEICNLLQEKKLRVDISHSIDYLGEWSYNEHTFFICPYGDLR